MLIPGKTVISQDTVLQGENLEFTAVGYYHVNENITLTIKPDCLIYAHPEQVLFDGPGKVICELNGKVSANWWFDNDFGKRLSKCYESAQQAALIEHYGNHKIKSSVNATQRDAERQIHRHYGSYEFNLNGIVFDYSRRRQLIVENLDIIQRGSKIPKVGVLQSRDETHSSTNHCSFKNCRVSGKFDIAALYNHSSNFSRYESCHFLSTGVGAGVILTVKNEEGVISDYCELNKDREVNLCQTFESCHLQGRGIKGAISVEGLNGLILQQCWVQANGNSEAYIILDNKKASVLHVLIKNGMADTADDLTKPLHYLITKGKDCANRSYINAHPQGTAFTSNVMIKKEHPDSLEDSILQINGVVG